ncbi:dihydroorotase [Kordiimonas pumila]|uniref:Dihydroorotase family protein n=1 Tax=Kordiimonas pumila TaxID=2161677 RepID=A0ABV7D1D1_9PROT|nr:dihydroorotase [Kordiimonas pumila]
MSIAFINARLMDPATELDAIGSLVTNGDRIGAVGVDIEIPSDAEIVDCGGRILCPGLIDMRVHSVDVASALAGGVTTVILQPDQTTVIDTDPVVERIRSRSVGSNSVSVYPMGAATRGLQGDQLAEIGQMKQSGAVAFTDCRKATEKTQVMRRLLEYAEHFDALIVQFPEDPELAEDGLAHEGEVASRMGLIGIPSEAEVIQIERDIRLAEMTGARIHFSLLSSRDGLEAIRTAKKRGAKVTCSTAPHYLHLNENAVEGYRTFAKVSPPLRSESDRLALIEGVADGTIDTLVSDHDPRSEDVKRLPFGQAATGIVGLETLLPLSLSHVHSGKINMMTLIRTLTQAPAELLELDTGRLEIGRYADLTIFDPDKPWRIDEAAFQSSAKNTPFDTLPVQGQVWRTIIGGKTLFNVDTPS